MRTLLSLFIVASAIVPMFALPRTAVACSGGGAPLEAAAEESEIILLGTAIEVGDGVNRAPTVTGTATMTATATPAWWEGRTPAPTPTGFPPIGPAPDIDLAGIDAVLRVDAVYAGDPGEEFATGQESRASIERSLREWDSRPGGVVRSCELDAFVPRYEVGGQYLLFVEDSAEGVDYVWAVFRIDGGEVLSGLDPLVTHGAHGWLLMESATYARYFAGQLAQVTEYGAYFDERRVPLANVLAAVAGLRGDVTIVPPDAGSAGLKAR